MKPSDGVGKPILVIFTDGSTVAHGTCADIRWELKRGGYAIRLTAAKNRLAPNR